MGALDRHIADDDAAPNTRAEREQYQARKRPRRSDPELTVSRGIAIIGIRDRVTAMGRHSIADGKMIPARKIASLEDDPSFQIEWSGRAETDPGNVVGMDADHVCQQMHCLTHALRRLLWATRSVCGLSVKGQHSPLVIDDGSLDVSATEIDAGIEGPLRLCHRQPVGSIAHRVNIQRVKN